MKFWILVSLCQMTLFAMGTPPCFFQPFFQKETIFVISCLLISLFVFLDEETLPTGNLPLQASLESVPIYCYTSNMFFWCWHHVCTVHLKFHVAASKVISICGLCVMTPMISNFQPHLSDTVSQNISILQLNTAQAWIRKKEIY